MLMICDDGAKLESPAELDAKPDHVAWMRDLDERDMSRGRYLMRPPAEAKTVRVRDGKELVSDGPFAETKEWVAGVELIECADLDEAIAIASAHEAAGRYPIEIRPYWED
ncbi:YciI family protein [Kibdelosporangium persicum]|nr:YciI family protein [Kibdelosporangium persicum]